MPILTTKMVKMAAGPTTKSPPFAGAPCKTAHGVKAHGTVHHGNEGDDGDNESLVENLRDAERDVLNAIVELILSTTY